MKNGFLHQSFKISFVEVSFICNKIHPFYICNSISFDRCIQLCNHHHSHDTEYFCHPRKFLHVFLQSVLSWQSLTCFCLCSFAFFRILYNQNCTIILFWLLSLNIMLLILMHIVASVHNPSFLLPFYFISIIWLYLFLFAIYH